jgi:carbonic anhydrase
MQRREFLIAAAGLTAGGFGGVIGQRRFSSAPSASESGPVVHSAAKLVADAPTAEVALQKLIDGNRRFVDGKTTLSHENQAWRAQIAEAQHPFAAVLGCADSRVPPEMLFDEGFGDLFVVGEAGGVADDDTLGSREYAVKHLHVPLIVVLGHQSCGAVAAAVGAVVNETVVEGHMIRLVDDIAPAVWEVREQPGNIVELAIRANVAHVVQKLRISEPVLRRQVSQNNVRVVGAHYDLRSGVVEWLDV